MVAAAEEERDLHAIALAVRDALAGSRARPRGGGDSADASRPGRRSGRRSTTWRSTSRMAQATSFTCATTPAGSRTIKPVLARFDDGLGLRLLLEHDVDARALDRDGDVIGERFEQLALVERQAARRRCGAPSTPTMPRAVLSGHVEPFAARQRLGAAVRRARRGPRPRRRPPSRCRRASTSGGCAGAHREPPAVLREDDGRRARRDRSDGARPPAAGRRGRRRRRSGARRRTARRCAPRDGARAPPGRGRAPSAGSSGSRP